jgi:hypothetical protein
MNGFAARWKKICAVGCCALLAAGCTSYDCGARANRAPSGMPPEADWAAPLDPANWIAACEPPGVAPLDPACHGYHPTSWTPWGGDCSQFGTPAGDSGQVIPAPEEVPAPIPAPQGPHMLPGLSAPQNPESVPSTANPDRPHAKSETPTPGPESIDSRPDLPAVQGAPDSSGSQPPTPKFAPTDGTQVPRRSISPPSAPASRATPEEALFPAGGSPSSSVLNAARPIGRMALFPVPKFGAPQSGEGNIAGSGMSRSKTTAGQIAVSGNSYQRSEADESLDPAQQGDAPSDLDYRRVSLTAFLGPANDPRPLTQLPPSEARETVFQTKSNSLADSAAREILLPTRVHPLSPTHLLRPPTEDLKAPMPPLTLQIQWERAAVQAAPSRKDSLKSAFHAPLAGPRDGRTPSSPPDQTEDKKYRSRLILASDHTNTPDAPRPPEYFFQATTSISAAPARQFRR